MKTKLTILLFISVISLGLAQNPSKKAQKITDKITEAISLTEEQSKVVYEIQLERFRAAEEIKTKYADDQETKKKMLKQNGNKTYNRMKNLLGKEKMKEWKQYRKNNKK